MFIFLCFSVCVFVGVSRANGYVRVGIRTSAHHSHACTYVHFSARVRPACI